jgi:hypothetical protein
MADEREIAELRRSLVTIANALTDRATLIRLLVDELMAAFVRKGLFTEDELRSIVNHTLTEREASRSQYRIPDDESAAEKIAKLHDEMSADVIDLAAIRAKLQRD